MAIVFNLSNTAIGSIMKLTLAVLLKVELQLLSTVYPAGGNSISSKNNGMDQYRLQSSHTAQSRQVPDLPKSRMLHRYLHSANHPCGDIQTVSAFSESFVFECFSLMPSSSLVIGDSRTFFIFESGSFTAPTSLVSLIQQSGNS
jgi:hypothetical protein